MTTRRNFLAAAAAAGAVPPPANLPAIQRPTDGKGWIERDWNAPEVGQPYPRWQPGEMDLHFMYFGTGESMFYMLPDGTTWVNDCGDFFRPHELKFIPRRPSADLLGAEWAARYISRLTKKRHLDYVTVSHWHSDHVGGPDIRKKRFPSGREACGIAALGEFFTFGSYFDHEWPLTDKYGTADVAGMAMTREFAARAAAETGMRVESFRPGALNQISLRHDPQGRYAGSFSVRNIAANGVIWTGRAEESFDAARGFMETTGQNSISQNTLSMSLVVRYGDFAFYTGGDTNGKLLDESGKTADFEERVARMAGPVTLAKCNHHACRGSMSPGVVGRLRAQAYVANVWCPRHVVDAVMCNISSRGLYPGPRFLFPTFLAEEPREKWTTADWWRDVAPPGHIAVKVAPGGGSYKVYVMRTVDEDMTVVAVYRGTPA